MKLNDKQLEALVVWADESERPNGCTAWGPKFDAVMEVAKQVRDSQKPSSESCGHSMQSMYQNTSTENHR